MKAVFKLNKTCQLIDMVTEVFLELVPVNWPLEPDKRVEFDFVNGQVTVDVTDIEGLIDPVDGVVVIELIIDDKYVVDNANGLRRLNVVDLECCYATRDPGIKDITYRLNTDVDDYFVVLPFACLIKE